MATNPLETLRRRHRELLLRRASAHDFELQQVAEQLFIGSLGGVVTPGVLEQYGVSHVLCVSTGVKEEMLQRKQPDASVSVARLQDSANDPAALLQALPILLGFLAAVVEEGHSILVCSFRGCSRSAAVVIAYLMLTRSCSLRDAALQVARARDCAVPNRGFVMALMALEGAIAAQGGEPLSLGEGDAETKLVELVQVAQTLLPSLMAKGPLPKTLWLEEGLEPKLPLGLCDFSEKTLKEDIIAISEWLLAEGGSGKDARVPVSKDDNDDIEDDDDEEEVIREMSKTCSSTGEEIREMSKKCSTTAIGNEEELIDEEESNDKDQEQELEAQKADAVARNDFAEASRLRDCLRVLKERASASIAVASRPAATPPSSEVVEARRQELMRLKEAAVQREDFEQAAELRNALRELDQMAAKASTAAASEDADGAKKLEARRQELLQMKAAAVQKEDFAEAAKIRNALRDLVGSGAAAKLEASGSAASASGPNVEALVDEAMKAAAREAAVADKRAKHAATTVEEVEAEIAALEAASRAVKLAGGSSIPTAADDDRDRPLSFWEKCLVYPVALGLAFVFYRWCNSELLRAFPPGTLTPSPKEL